ncbi:uncharacterized protein B0P05DRAFT_186484 [Gilbertella persicaria]|uniref:uncharacterized protein n=1 Tax=Gilbertella persicaria TaxID=101096 RepID=UPI00221FB517|nr:uncharacterized protein B0P05DRAFT_186484 [Gilbertella persicaria]KAI8070624.1 hypothetical protein B0P05DRAFT_186484 [Gilbertella persicaria]
MYFLASRLKSLGMKHVEAIGHASVPICKFVDPQTGFSCDINTNNILGIENTRMIGTYANLDVRIRPFLAAIKQFVKQKEINNPRGGTLSSYAYVIMALHFLMIGLEQPLIPSLQKSNLRCQSKHCNAKRGKFVHLYHDHQIIRCDARYHDCVHIRNTATSTYKMSPPVGKNDTITYWEGANKDTVSSILTQFFAYYANPSNHIVSIVTEDGALYGNYEPSYWHGNPIIVQDPFILGKNVARSCTTQGAYAIFAEFKRAAQLLQENTPFSTVCDKRYNIERSIDTECMEYRFQVQKHHHTKQYQTKDNYIGVLEEKELDEVIEILNPPLKDVSVVEEGKDQAMLALVKKIMSYQTVDSSIDHLTASPCTDMKALLHDPCMSKVELKDLYYLIAQMNFLGDALDDMFTEDKQEPDTKLNGFVEEESDELVDVFEHAHDEVTDVYFYILNVPITVDFYEIFLNLAWYGQLLSATPSRDPNGDDNEWLIHMKTPYINYKENRLPCFIELGKDQKQCTLSVPQLQPHELKRN